MRRRKVILGVAIVIAVAGALAWTAGRPLLRAAGSTQSPTSSAPASGAAVRKVQAVHPERETMSRDTRLPATVEPFEEADLYAKVSGYVGEVRVDIGDRVNAGDVL